MPLGLGLLTGLLSSLAELPSWNRADMAGVGERQVARFTIRTWLVAAAALLVVAGTVGALALPTTIQQLKASRTVAPDPVAEAAAAIRAVVAVQSAAMQQLDVTAFLATLDPAENAYVMEQRHWLENAVTWRKNHPTDPVGRKVEDIRFLGDNTARVQIQQSPGGFLDTIWTKTSDGRWLEHGRDHAVLQDGPVTVWYPSLMQPNRAREVAVQVQQVLEQLKKVGWSIRTPVTVELLSDRSELRRSLGPGLAERSDIFYYWSEYGEPLRFPVDRPILPETIMRALVYESVRQASHNQAAEWLPEGLARYAITRTTGAQQPSEVRGILPLTSLPETHPLYDRDLKGLAMAVDAAWMLAEYLTEHDGPDSVNQVLAALAAAAPDDPEMTGEATVARRDQRTIAAFEQVTGRSWEQLDRELQAWFQTKFGEVGP